MDTPGAAARRTPGAVGGGRTVATDRGPHRASDAVADSRPPRRSRPSANAGAAGKPLLAVTVTDEAGRALRDPGVGRWLARVAPSKARGRSVTVAFVSDRVIRRLNRRYAARDAVTDVLAFPAGPDPAAEVPAPLGEIVVAAGRAARQARDAGHRLQTEYRVLVLHGLLHLLGYDHHGDGGRMARIERRLRRLGGLGEGLIERAAGR